MRFNLNAVGLKHQAQTQGFGGFNDALRKRFPIKIRPGAEMGVVISNRPIHLAHDLDVGYFFTGRLQAHHHVGNFFAYRCGAGRLPMGAAEHGNVGVGMRHIA